MRFDSLFIIASTFPLYHLLFTSSGANLKGSVTECLSRSCLYHDACLFGISSSKCSTDVIPSLARRVEVESDELLDRADFSGLSKCQLEGICGFYVSRAVKSCEDVTKSE